MQYRSSFDTFYYRVNDYKLKILEGKSQINYTKYNTPDNMLDNTNGVDTDLNVTTPFDFIQYGWIGYRLENNVWIKGNNFDENKLYWACNPGMIYQFQFNRYNRKLLQTNIHLIDENGNLVNNPVEEKRTLSYTTELLKNFNTMSYDLKITFDDSLLSSDLVSISQFSNNIFNWIIIKENLSSSSNECHGGGGSPFSLNNPSYFIDYCSNSIIIYNYSDISVDFSITVTTDSFDFIIDNDNFTIDFPVFSNSELDSDITDFDNEHSFINLFSTFLKPIKFVFDTISNFLNGVNPTYYKFAFISFAFTVIICLVRMVF